MTIRRALCGVLMVTALAGCGRPDVAPSQDADGVRYLALGDSLSMGVGAGDEKLAFPARLADLWREQGCAVELKNVGVGGYTAEQVLSEEVPAIDEFAPTVITFQVGANDVAKSVPIDEYRRNVEAVLDAATGSGAQVIVLAQNDWPQSPQMRELGRDVSKERSAFDDVLIAEAAERGADFVDLRPLFAKQADDGQWAGDGLHPTADAYEAWAEQLAEAVPAPCG